MDDDVKVCPSLHTSNPSTSRRSYCARTRGLSFQSQSSMADSRGKGALERGISSTSSISRHSTLSPCRSIPGYLARDAARARVLESLIV